MMAGVPEIRITLWMAAASNRAKGDMLLGGGVRDFALEIVCTFCKLFL